MIIGLGNEFRGDDAIGILIVRKLQDENPDLAEYLIEQNDLTRILERWHNRYVIIIDAVFSRLPAWGKIHQLDSVHEISCISKKQYSSHGLELPDIYNIGKSLNLLPNAVFMIGIEGANWEIGSQMNGELITAIPGVISLVKQKMK